MYMYLSGEWELVSGLEGVNLGVPPIHTHKPVRVSHEEFVIATRGWRIKMMLWEWRMEIGNNVVIGK